MSYKIRYGKEIWIRKLGSLTLLSGYFIINMLINSFDPIIGWAESISFRLFFTKVKARIKYRNLLVFNIP